MSIVQLRMEYHQRVCEEIIRLQKDGETAYPNFADRGNKASRAIALGTGDLDCVYHFALPELRDAISEIGNEDQLDMLTILIEGRRLRDISDLPFDLAT